MKNTLHAIFITTISNILFLLVALLPGHNFGVAVIVITILVRLAIWPLVSKQLHSQKALTAIQPEANKLKDKFKNDPQGYNAAVMELYKEKEINPFSSCLFTLIQMPLLFALFYVFRPFNNPEYVNLANPNGIIKEVYGFLANWGPIHNYITSAQHINTAFFPGLDLAKSSIILGVVAGALQFVQSWMLLPKHQEKDAASAMSKQMMFMGPILTIYISAQKWMPGALPLYWGVSTLFAILQQYLVARHEVEIIEEKSDGKKRK
jgi:YidC/Oxa1 family membrane protein insertase